MKKCHGNQRKTNRSQRFVVRPSARHGALRKTPARAHHSVKRGSRQFELDINLLPVGVGVIAADGRVVQVSRRLGELLGYRPGELIGRSFLSIVHREDRPAYTFQMQLMLADKTPTCFFAIRCTLKDGRVAEVNLWVILERKADTTPDYFIITIDNIDQRKQAVWEREESAVALQVTQHLAHVGNWTWDLQTGDISWSDELYMIFGRDRNTPPLQYLEFQTVLTPQSWTVFSASLEKIITDRVPYRCEVELVWSDGTHRWIVCCGDTLCDANGKVAILYGTVQDITEGKQNNDALQEQKNLLRQILDTANVAIFLANREGRITQVNRGMAEMFGYSIEELIGKQYLSLVHPTEKEIGRQKMAELLTSLVSSADVDRLYRRADQTEFWGHLTGQRFYNAKGEESGLVCVIIDITQRKKAENTLTTFFDQSMSLHLIVQLNGVILRVNLGWDITLGYKQDELIGANVLDLIHPDDLAASINEIAKLSQGINTLHFENRYRHKNGEFKLFAWSANFSAEDQLIYAVGSDITTSRAAEEEIKYLAFFDPLTGLPNRRLLFDRLRQALVSSVRTGQYGALMFIDLDDFKTINDNCGHDKGDILLHKVAERLCLCVRAGDTVARLGGDEFLVMLNGLSKDAEEASLETASVGEKILNALRDPYDLAGHHLRCTCSIGVTLFSNHHYPIEELLKRADLAMYQAKTSGRNALRFFDAELQAIVATRIALDREFRQAIRREEFILHFQAQVSAEGKFIGVEALVRWDHPQRGMVLPDEFIPIAEETGLILPLGQWILEKALTQLTAWSIQPAMADITMAVNVSAIEFRHADYVKHVLAIIDKTGANPQKIKLEITESVLLHNVDDIIVKMIFLQSYGIRFSLDDFGTGYSSLSYLKRLPIDQLKIDQSFVVDSLTDKNNATIAAAIIALGQSLGMTVIAEGVESEEQRMFLAKHHCDVFQGYLFGHPMAPAELEHFLKRQMRM